MTKYPLYSVMDVLQELYGIELDDDTFELYATRAYTLIGNQDCRLKVIKARVMKDPDERAWYVCKPCDMSEIEAITLPFEGGLEISATDDFMAYKTYPIELWIENFKYNRDLFYLPGKFVKYTELADKIYFTEPYEFVNILYKALELDENGLPMVSQHEAFAIAAFCAYAHDLKHGRVHKDQNTLAIALAEYQQWQKLCSKARVAESISQNEMNEILDTLTSYDVHKYGTSSTKPIK